MFQCVANGRCCPREDSYELLNTTGLYGSNSRAPQPTPYAFTYNLDLIKGATSTNRSLGLASDARHRSVEDVEERRGSGMDFDMLYDLSAHIDGDCEYWDESVVDEIPRLSNTGGKPPGSLFRQTPKCGSDDPLEPRYAHDSEEEVYRPSSSSKSWRPKSGNSRQQDIESAGAEGAIPPKLLGTKTGGPLEGETETRAFQLARGMQKQPDASVGTSSSDNSNLASRATIAKAQASDVPASHQSTTIGSDAATSTIGEASKESSHDPIKEKFNSGLRNLPETKEQDSTASISILDRMVKKQMEKDKPLTDKWRNRMTAE